MLLGVAEAAAKMLGVLPVVRPGEVLLLLPTVLTAKLPGEAFFTGTTTLLQGTEYASLTHARKNLTNEYTCIMNRINSRWGTVRRTNWGLLSRVRH